MSVNGSRILGGPGQPDTIVRVSRRSRIGAFSSPGIGYKPWNEDRVVAAADDDDFMAVIDGMGGHENGGAAAQIIAEELARTPQEVQEALQRAQVRIKAANLGEHAGACVTTARLVATQDSLTIESYRAGDVRRIIARSRTFLQRLLRRMPTIEATTDQTLMQYLLALGLITPEEAKTHRLRGVVSNAITAENCNPVHETVLVRPGDRVLLLDDGGTENFAGNDELVALGLWRSVRGMSKHVRDVVLSRMLDYEGRKDRGLPAKRDNVSGAFMDIR